MSAPPSIAVRTAGVAGRSAERESQRAAELVRRYEQQLAVERKRQSTYAVASQSERDVAAVLGALTSMQWHLLCDRQWPGTRANIDMILIGPGGVIVIDVKAWTEPSIVDGRLYRGQLDVTDEIDTLLAATERVRDTTDDVGLAPQEVRAAIVLAGDHQADTTLRGVQVLDIHTVLSWLVARGERLAPARVDALVSLLAERFPAHVATSVTHELPTDAPDPVATPAPDAHQPPTGRHRDDHPQAALFDEASLHQALIDQAAAGTIEEWMTFLHPEQLRLVRRNAAGASRIRGAAGTGKTVVALHRAAAIAQSTTGPVLVTSLIKTLPAALQGLYARLSPGTADRVEFLNLHAWALRFLTDRGADLRIDPKLSLQAFNRAWAAYGKSSGLVEISSNSAYWKDEIDYVIKGRGITEFDEYAHLARVGRRSRMGEAARSALWQVYRDYEQHLTATGHVDFNDLLTLALAEVRATALSRPYEAVIVDEAQDLNCQAIRLVAELSGGGDRLLIVGDGQQQIFPGGFTLGEAGISVSGRSSVLRTNYRNGAEILHEAARLVAGDEYLDLDGTPERGEAEVVAVRPGGEVHHAEARSIDELRGLAVHEVVALIDRGARPAEIAVLCSSNLEVSTFQKMLKKAGVASLRLSEYQGVAVNSVKVGTVPRSKGLEFKHVVLPVHPRPRARSRVEPEELLHEQREQANRQLFVAMTRARDSLWIGRIPA